MPSLFRNIFIIFISLLLLTQSTSGAEGNKTDDVNVTEILSNPKKFDGKKLSIVGNYHIKFESHVLSDGNRNRLWVGRPSEYATLSDINEVNNSRSRVIGTFISGRSGHLGRYPGRIENITHVKALSGWTEFSPLGFKLEGIIISPIGNNALFVDSRGKGWTVKEGHFFPGIISKKVKRILKDRIIFIEDFENYKGIEVREFEMVLEKNFGID
ncbi:hypothetical protein D3OALGB2SA_2277 [Olavius algarvensis associated proteobacterium Delta 3]|nr:hypothetical protein D3OALGB2SA_2277 [Olavius algarvensis associated proteobacterium Delta 3]